MAAYETDNTVFGYVSSETQAEAAVRELYAAGFTRNQISVAGQPDDNYSRESTTASTTGGKLRHEGHKAGEAAEGFWDRVKTFFEGESPEPYADERTRGELATHEITTGSDVYDYDPEDLHQSWSGSGYFGQKYDTSGEGYILSVSAGDRRAEAVSILESNGADLGSSASTASAPLTRDYSAASRSSETADSAYAGSAASDDLRSPRRIQLYGEVLRVHRDRVQRGEARLRKETITETQNIQVPVTREELVIERVPVSGEQPATAATFGTDTEEIRIPLSEERVRVEKEAVVREQVQVGTRQVTNTETREETVRRQELRVDNDEDSLRKAS